MNKIISYIIAALIVLFVVLGLFAGILFFARTIAG